MHGHGHLHVHVQACVNACIGKSLFRAALKARFAWQFEKRYGTAEQVKELIAKARDYVNETAAS